VTDARRVAAVAGIVGLQLAVAAALVRLPSIMVPLTIACVAVVLLAVRGAVFVFALPACFAASRVVVAGVDLSIADLVLVALTIVAIPFVDWSTTAVRRLVLLGAGYFAILAVNVFAVTTGPAAVEWVHRWFLVVGSLLVGAAIGATKRTTAALRATLVVALVFAVMSIVESIGSGFRPAYTFGYHKNFVGPLVAMVALTLIAARREFRLPSWSITVAQVVLVGGLLATQSRASIVGLAIGVAVLFVRDGRVRWRAIALVPVILAMLYFVYATVRTSLTGANDTRFNPIRSRLAQYDVAWGHFVDHPVFGIGIRWFKTAGTINAEPHSAFFVTISESGLWGLFALVVVFAGSWLLLRRSESPLASAAIALLAFRLAEGQLAIFWLAGTMTFPWIVVGVAAATSQRSAPDALAHSTDTPTLTNSEV